MCRRNTHSTALRVRQGVYLAPPHHSLFPKLTRFHSEGCGHYEDAIVYKNMSSDVSAYEYCDAWPGDKTFSVARCQKCLFVDDNKYMANCKLAQRQTTGSFRRRD